MNNLKPFIFERMNRLDQWIVENDWKAYDPFDGLSSQVLEPLTFNNHYLRIAVQQFVRRFPFNIRPFVGISPQTSSKGMGFCALGYLKLYQATGSEAYHSKVRHCLDWLVENYCSGYNGYAWGNHFTYESRGGDIQLDVPTVVWTSLIANVFLDAHETLGDPKFLEIAKSAGNHIMQDIAFHEENGNLCFMYTPDRKSNNGTGNCVHNANVLCARLLARLYGYNNDKSYFDMARKSIGYTVNHQLPNGGWYYGEPSKNYWVDSFHTGYVLESIHDYAKATGDTSFSESLQKGYDFFISTFFLPDGTPRYYDHKTYPIDIQCASQGIQTLVNLREYAPNSLEIAKNTALWTINNMQSDTGYFYFRKYPLITNKTPTFHWGQATMLSGLAHLYSVMEN